MIAPDTTNEELELAIYVCKRTGLDPFARQIYFVKRSSGGKKQMTSQTSIDGFRLMADRTGHAAGQDDYLFDEGLTLYQHLESKRGNPKVATVTVYKIIGGVRCPYTATASWTQYFPGESQGFMWRKMPHLMLGKCAEALALRKAFPAELSGIYTSDEMSQADKVVGERVSFEDQMAAEKERIARKENGVINTESIPVDTSTLPERENQAPTPPAPPKVSASSPDSPATKAQTGYVLKLLDGLNPEQADKFVERITGAPLNKTTKAQASEFIAYLIAPGNAAEIKQAKADLLKEADNG